MNEVTMSSFEFKEKTVVIVMFGPATPVRGLKPAEYYQVTIDPSMVSPSGKFIRFGKHPGDELLGWQNVDGLTVVECLGVWDGEIPPKMEIGAAGVTMLSVD